MVQKGYLRIHKRHDFCENISKIVSDDVIEELSNDLPDDPPKKVTLKISDCAGTVDHYFLL